MIVSYKEIQSLAGYSALINEVSDVFEEIQQGKFERTITSNVDGQEIHEKQNLNTLQKGKVCSFKPQISFKNLRLWMDLNTLNLIMYQSRLQMEKIS